MPEYRLTEYSHGAGCGCKIAPGVLDVILQNTSTIFEDPRLLVGSDSRDDAAVFDLGNGQAVISTTDFFMPKPASVERTGWSFSRKLDGLRPSPTEGALSRGRYSSCREFAKI